MSAQSAPREPWRYRCADCESVSLSRLTATDDADYRCGVCGHKMRAGERIDAKTEE